MNVRTNLICLTTIALLTAALASADVMVWLDPTNPTVNVGETVMVDIMADFEEPVMAWGLDLMIAEPMVAGLTQIAIGSEWDVTDTLDGDGLAGLRFPTGVGGQVLLATLTFEGLAIGETALDLSSGPEEDEGFLLESGYMATNVNFIGATLTVVPEPATLLLAMGIIVLARRR